MQSPPRPSIVAHYLRNFVRLTERSSSRLLLPATLYRFANATARMMIRPRMMSC